MFGIHHCLGLLTLGSVLAAPVHAAEKFVGEWNGENSTSIEIISDDPLRVLYCYENDCNEFPATGTKDRMVLVFEAGNGFPGATMKVERDGRLMRAVYKRDNSDQSFKVTLAPG